MTKADALPLVVQTVMEWATPDHPARVRAVSKHTSAVREVDYDFGGLPKEYAHQLAVQRMFPMAAVHVLRATESGFAFYVEPAIRR